MTGYLLTLDQALEFYTRCHKAKAETEVERLAIMEQMLKERRAFFQTEEQLKQRFKGKKVLRIIKDNQ